MSTLILHLDTPDDPESSCTFTREGQSSAQPEATESVLRFISDGLIHDGNNLVYRGRLIGFPGKIAERKAVCKIAQDSAEAMDRLRNEAQIYETALDEIQACSVPRFFGIYSGELEDDAAVCILLQDCGVPLKYCIQHYVMEFRIKVIQALLVIHAYGIRHNDFDEWNLVVDDGDNPQKVFVVDFDHATRHECKRRMGVWLYTVVPTWDGFGCDEIWRMAKGFGLWTPYYVRFMGESVSWELFKTPEELVKAGRTLSSTCEIEDPLRCAHIAIREWLAIYRDRKDYILCTKVRTIEPAWPPEEYGEEMD